MLARDGDFAVLALVAIARASRSPAASGFFFTLVTSPRRSLSLNLSDTRVYEPQIQARLGTTAHFCEVITCERGRAPSYGPTVRLLSGA